MIDNIDNDNGIVKYNTEDGEEYTFWTYADLMKPFIINFLKERFPGKLIVRELNLIDLSIPEDNLPIEIQATIVQNVKNIVSYHKCWFFFDSELLRSMMNVGRNMSIKFRNYMKEGKLKVFTVSHDRIIDLSIH